MLDVMLIWEGQPDIPNKWPYMIAFTGEPESSDLRPIALIISIFRVWARIRQELAKQWEMIHQFPEFWGCASRECDTAG
eukprot:2813452-Pyramimonas_sp.AAC.1